MNSALYPTSHGIYFFLKRRIMQISVLLASGILISALPAFQFSSPAVNKPTEVTHEITLVFAGDIMQHMPQVDAAWDASQSKYSYDSCFMFITPFVSNADIAIANLETTLAGKPYSGYPAFSSPDELVQGILKAGFDIAGTANNHCCDRGRKGIERTVSVLDSLGLMHMGTYHDARSYNQQNPVIITTRGFRLAFLNYTYGTNGIPVPENNVVSLIENERMLRDLKAASDSVVDKVIVFIHWGDEYQRQPNAFQKETASFLFNHGADIIIGSHPHVLQPMEWHTADSVNKERLVVWSLGNFVSNQRKQYTDGGAMVSVTLQKTAGKSSIKQAGYKLSWVFNPLISGRRQYYILPAASYENDTILLDAGSRSSLNQFLVDSRKLLGDFNVNMGEIK